jgi:hypothetical protein
MSPTALTPATPPLSLQRSATACTACSLPPLSMPKRGPQCKLGSHRVFPLLLWVLYTGMQWQGFPLPQHPTGKPVMHDTTVSKVFAQWAEEGSLGQACGASVRHLAAEKPRAPRVRHGAGPTPGAQKGARAWATPATSTRQGRRSSP